MVTRVELLNSGDVVEVRDSMSPRLWRLCSTIYKHRNNLEAIEEELLEAIDLLIVGHDEPGQYTFEDREVWETVRDEHGVGRLADAFEELVAPALDRKS